MPLRRTALAALNRSTARAAIFSIAKATRTGEENSTAEMNGD
jgi:hypothetical protein